MKLHWHIKKIACEKADSFAEHESGIPFDQSVFGFFLTLKNVPKQWN